ncbi:2TM domain-containing protein [Tenacibaculum ovolyticum]|uniref:2TM domain-containing protein n=1 Tax=Tenacibaculum ovolyticum TaxID=104270 RepID=UPI001F289929|nr:2TM domain-containing protein [Tenacibaculum ovolyticum]
MGNYTQVEKRVKRIKKFYNHLQVFAIMMIVLLLFSNRIFDFFESHIHNPGTLKWARTNIWANCLLWAFGLLIHGLYTFKYKVTFIEKWEKQKVEELMNEIE